MRKSAQKKIDNFFEYCQRNIEILSPEKVRERQSRYYDEEKIKYFSLKLKKLLSHNPEFSIRFKGEPENVSALDENSTRNNKPEKKLILEEDNTQMEELDIVTLNKFATRFCAHIISNFQERLNDREMFICEQLTKGKSMKSISYELDLTIERVRQIYEKCIRKIHKAFQEFVDEREAIRNENRVLKHRNALLEKELLYSESLKNVDNILKLEDSLCLGARKLLRSPLVDLDLPVRAINVLHSMKIKYFSEIPQLTVEDLLRVHSCGRKTIKDLQVYLSHFSLMLGLTYGEIVSRLAKMSDEDFSTVN